MRGFWRPKLDSIELKATIAEHLDAYEEIERTTIVLDRFRKMLAD
jgi:hypothetical protein